MGPSGVVQFVREARQRAEEISEQLMQALPPCMLQAEARAEEHQDYRLDRLLINS